MKYALGIDIGSSSVKIAIVNASNGSSILTAQFPDSEMPMITVQKSWAEQEPSMWWEAFLECIKEVDSTYLQNISHIGITYQMHGLVCVDEDQNVLRPSIIWCDSRAVAIGEKGMESLGSDYCHYSLLNSPGNFTASKLKWVKENEPEVFKNIDKIMLPGDYIAMKLSGVIGTTISGLSEGVFWDFKSKSVSQQLLDEYGFEHNIIPPFKNSFAEHAIIDSEIAKKLGISPHAKITYKAGDQPNNALSLNVLEPGEIAANAGTSGVLYGVVDSRFVDEKQRVNSFAHVNYATDLERVGVLLCINGVGISNAWVKKQFRFENYVSMNEAAKEVSPGADGLLFFPFGNGAERMLGNENIEASIEGLNYNIHNRAHFARAVQEGIAFSFMYGMEAFTDKKIKIQKIKAGHANMFLSDLFAQCLADLVQVRIELYNTDGAVGAARGSLIGGGVLSKEEAFSDLTLIKSYKPSENSIYPQLYQVWKNTLTNKILKK